MSHQLKVLVLDRDHFNLLLRGQARIRNLPQDGDVIGASPVGRQLGFVVYSASYPHADPGALPLVTAVVERL